MSKSFNYYVNFPKENENQIHFKDQFFFMREYPMRLAIPNLCDELWKSLFIFAPAKIQVLS